jgi:poly-gamma-glutamate synthesis protein (capsule biosynthesis protein)
MKVSIVGDVMLGGILSSNIGKYKNSFLSNRVRKYLEADITFCNLECPLTMAAPPLVKDKVLVHAEESLVELLKNAGFNVVSLANNHIMDFRFESLLETMKLLKENNIKYTGAGQNLREARKPVFFDSKDGGGKINFLAYAAPETWGGYVQRRHQTHKEWIAENDKPGVAPFDLKLIQEDIEKVKKESDFLILSIHWEEEDTYFPHPEIISDAHRIVDMGANLVVGHHPHILQGYKTRSF